jgi:hypothetical protein
LVKDWNHERNGRGGEKLQVPYSYTLLTQRSWHFQNICNWIKFRKRSWKGCAQYSSPRPISKHRTRTFSERLENAHCRENGATKWMSKSDKNWFSLWSDCT